MFYPEHTLRGAQAASQCGSDRFIVIPKCSSDGVWFAYHDDSFMTESTILRNADGTAIEESPYDTKRFYQIPFDYLQSLDWGVYKDPVFAGQKPLLIKDLFTLCAETGMKPMFSLHPYTTKEKERYEWEARDLRALAEAYRVLDRLTLKMTILHFTEVIYPAFGEEVEEYVVILPRNKSTDDDLRDVIEAIGQCGIDQSKTSVAIELWIDRATPEQIRMITDAGYIASLANCQHTGPDGNNHLYLETDDYLYWNSLGVTEFTDHHNPSLGLDWMNE